MEIVDAHVHVWDLDRFPLSWFRDDLRLPSIASAAALRDAAAAASRLLVAAVAVQAADTLAEMTWLRELAGRDAVVRSAVLQYAPPGGGVDDGETGRGGDSGDGGWAGLASTVLDERVRGVRVATPRGAADLSDVPGLDALCDGAAATGRVVEMLVRPAQLPAVAVLAERHPATTFVLCHLGLGAAAPDDAWRESLAAVARRENTAAKFSGVATAPGDHDRLRALADVAFAAFGGARLMFGSDWPMSARAVSYHRLVDDVAAAWGDRPETFWGRTAADLYRC